MSQTAETEAPAELAFHPFANLLPLIKGKAFDDLVADIKLNGQVEPIWLYDGQILDGRNRYRACVQAGVEPQVRDFEGTEAEALELVSALNIKRRHLTTSQLGMAASELALVKQKMRIVRNGRYVKGPDMTRDEAADQLGVSRFLVSQAARIREKAAPHIVDMVERGEVKIAAAETVALAYSIRRQKSLVTPEQIDAAAAEIRASRRRFQGHSAARVLKTIHQIAEETTARDGLDDFVAAADADTLGQLDQALERIQVLRAAVAQKVTPT